MDKKIIDKISKMIALSKDNGNEGSTALEMAEKLMDTYGVSYQQIEESRLEDELGFIGETEGRQLSNIKHWEKVLAQVIAVHFGCMTYIHKVRNAGTHWKMKSAICFVGHESNRITCEYIYEWLKKAIRKEARKNVSSKYLIDSYCYGACSALHTKYKAEKPYGTGLVVVDAVQRYVNENLNLTSGRQRQVNVYSSASLKGAEFGKTISLNRQCKSDGLKLIQ